MASLSIINKDDTAEKTMKSIKLMIGDDKLTRSLIAFKFNGILKLL